MEHLNKWGWYTASDAYQTYDYVKCPMCRMIAIEFYHTEFIWMEEAELPKPVIKLEYDQSAI
jgi:hypothetical protein